MLDEECEGGNGGAFGRVGVGDEEGLREGEVAGLEGGYGYVGLGWGGCGKDDGGFVGCHC